MVSVYKYYCIYESKYCYEWDCGFDYSYCLECEVYNRMEDFING